MDVEYPADLYGQGWTLREIGAELGFIGARSANSSSGLTSLCVEALPLIPPPLIRFSNSLPKG